VQIDSDKILVKKKLGRVQEVTTVHCCTTFELPPDGVACWLTNKTYLAFTAERRYHIISSAAQR
jgi:hypothetical protein